MFLYKIGPYFNFQATFETRSDFFNSYFNLFDILIENKHKKGFAKMPNIIKKLEKELPSLTGVYIFKNAQGEILYIGKAKDLHSRVSSYFQKCAKDWKIKQLIDEYDDIDYILTRTETESLLLEAQIIQQHNPPFNVLLKEGQPFLYILFCTKQDIVVVKLVRNKKEKGTYIGPFLQKAPARKTYNFIMRTFRLNLCNKKLEHGCLDYHIGNCAGSCKPDFDVADYTFRVQLAYDTLKNNQRDFIQKIKLQMALYAAEFAFEKAQQLNMYLQDIDFIFATMNAHFTEQKFATDIFVASTPTPYNNNQQADINTELQTFLQYKTPIRTIDCFDISHFQSSHIVGSCVRFTNGKPDKNSFRRFKIKTLTEQNDYAALQEIVQRRYKSTEEYPDLIVIDGGKGQLSAVKQVLPDAHVVSLAKKEEILYGEQFSEGIHLDIKTPVGKLIIALRDYAHHFAISYHRLKKNKEWK